MTTYNGPCSGGPKHDQVLEHDADHYEVTSEANVLLGTYVWDGYYIWEQASADTQARSSETV